MSPSCLEMSAEKRKKNDEPTWRKVLILSIILSSFSFSKVDRVHNAIFFLHLHQSIMKDYRVFLRYRNLFSMSTVPKNKYLLTDAPSIPSYRPSMENNSKGTPIEVNVVKVQETKIC